MCTRVAHSQFYVIFTTRLQMLARVLHNLSTCIIVYLELLVIFLVPTFISCKMYESPLIPIDVKQI